ncbi:MAG: LuxR C-terminal-related transcriptional regulator, partial [Candidatus Dormibacteria bacterium]
EAEALFTEASSTVAEAGLRSAEALQGLGEVAVSRQDLRAARTLLEEALDVARARQNGRQTASVLGSLGRLARAQEDAQRAVALLSESLELYRRGGYAPGIAQALEDLGGLALDLSVPERAARLLGAAQALRDAQGYARPPVLEPVHQADVAAARDSLGTEACERAWRAGTALPAAEAVTYALKGWGPRVRGATGWSGLSRAERDVVSLVAEGLTNVEIGQRLFISPRTVETHLTHIFAKLDLNSRRELAREAVRRRDLE